MRIDAARKSVEECGADLRHESARRQRNDQRQPSRRCVPLERAISHPAAAAAVVVNG